ncbi:MAG: hypothetical protein E6J09_08125 [Chloroflexi bacterium]|nr:MAG: hypothetical protein E6J09_08125 [Chloroflexota bacterium]
MNGPTQHRPGSDCALCSAHSKAAKRHTADPRTRTQLYLPWIVLFALSLALVPFSAGPERWVALGLVFGIGAGAALSWFSHQTNRHIAATTLASASEELKNEADQRVTMVIRQFEWAVNDVANLRDALKRAQDARAVSEASETRIRRRLHRLERQLYEARVKIGEFSSALGSATPAGDEEPAVLPTTDELVVPLTWRVFEENLLTWLRFESAGIVPSQVRIMNEHGTVITISARALDTLEDGAQVTLVLRAPDEVVAALEGRKPGRFTFEALVDDTWCKVELKASVPAKKQKRGRAAKPVDDREPQSLIA